MEKMGIIYHTFLTGPSMGAFYRRKATGRRGYTGCDRS